MKEIFDKVSLKASKITTQYYSTSFSLGIVCLNKRFRDPIFSIYGFVRFADEIVDTFHNYNKRQLLDEFERETYLAIDRKISLNPILNSFQAVYHQYHIDQELVESFLLSMRLDLHRATYETETYNQYIYGSAEVVGLMCLKVFCQNDADLYNKLKPYAQKLGAAFQKVNFLRDANSDFKELGRVYFPDINLMNLTEHQKQLIEYDIEGDFHAALQGIKMLPATSRFGVYVAYVYYYALFTKIKALPSARIMAERIRINNYRKIWLLCCSYCRHSLRWI